MDPPKEQQISVVPIGSTQSPGSVRMPSPTAQMYSSGDAVGRYIAMKRFIF